MKEFDTPKKLDLKVTKKWKSAKIPKLLREELVWKNPFSKKEQTVLAQVLETLKKKKDLKKVTQFEQFEDLKEISKEYGNANEQNMKEAVNQLHQNAIQLAFQMKSIHVFHKSMLQKIKKFGEKHPLLSKLKIEFKSYFKQKVAHVK